MWSDLIDNHHATDYDVDEIVGTTIAFVNIKARSRPATQ